jgi:outer membrane protein TolC
LDGPRPLGLYLQVAAERNPRILAAQREVAAIVETIPQETALENPMLQDTFWPDPEHSPQTASGRMPNSLMVTQQLPWLAKLRVRGEVAEQEAKMALAQLNQAQLEVIEQVSLAYYDIYYYQQAIRITEENAKLLRDLVSISEARLRTGGSQQDVLRAQLEVDQLQNQLIELRQQLRMAQADLAALLHASPDLEPLALEPLVLPETPAVIEWLYEVAVRCRPELQERLHTIVREERRRELAALEKYPDFTAGFSWDAMTTDQAIAPTADGLDNYGVIVGASLPIWHHRIRAGVREAEHRMVESARSYDATRDDTFRQIRRLMAQILATEQQIDLYRDTILPRAGQTLRVSIPEYSTGGTDFFQVFNNYSEVLRLQIQLARLQANLGQSLASLERVIGCQLASLLHVPPPEPHPLVGDSRRP